MLSGNRHAKYSATVLLSALIRHSLLALSLHSRCGSEAQAIDMAETDSATNQFGAPDSAEDPRRIFPLFVARVCPSHPSGIYG
jgi:hypothetical protein